VAVVYARTDDRVAHMRGVKVGVRLLRDEVAAAAEALLAQHRRTGEHRIVKVMEDTDGLVILEGRAAITLEYGRGGYTRDDGTYVGPMEPLNILGRAAGL
jgi:hypothetical protein